MSKILSNGFVFFSSRHISRARAGNRMLRLWLRRAKALRIPLKTVAPGPVACPSRPRSLLGGIVPIICANSTGFHYEPEKVASSE
jgi:hypothetical protein